MVAVREYATVRDRQVSVSLPASFEAMDVEVIVLPRREGEDLSFLEKAIDEGEASGISPRFHSQIIQALKKKYA
jgi:hypothetical protein